MASPCAPSQMPIPLSGSSCPRLADLWTANWTNLAPQESHRRSCVARLAIQALFGSVLNQNRNVVPHPARVQGPVLLLDDVFDVFPRHGWVLVSEPVHNMAECPQFFVDSHSKIVGSGCWMFKTGIPPPGMLRLPEDTPPIHLSSRYRPASSQAPFYGRSFL